MNGRNLKMFFLWDILMRHSKVKRLRFAITSDLTLPHRFELRVDGTVYINGKKKRGCGKENQVHVSSERKTEDNTSVVGNFVSQPLSIGQNLPLKFEPASLSSLQAKPFISSFMLVQLNPIVLGGNVASALVKNFNFLNRPVNMLLWINWPSG